VVIDEGGGVNPELGQAAVSGRDQAGQDRFQPVAELIRKPAGQVTPLIKMLLGTGQKVDRIILRLTDQSVDRGEKKVGEMIFFVDPGGFKKNELLLPGQMLKDGGKFSLRYGRERSLHRYTGKCGYITEDL
jgi:hypothetical protein